MLEKKIVKGRGKKPLVCEMAAVSLSEAWNDPPQSMNAQNNPRVSAKRTRTIEDDIVEEVQMPERHVHPEEYQVRADHDALLQEFRLLRAEESRRCTVYLAVGGVLFAVLFIYIDKLQTQIKMLNMCLLHPQSQALAVGAPMQQSMPFPAQKQWYS